MSNFVLGSSHSSTRRAFTLPEMLAVIALIVIVIALLLPAFGKSKDAAWDAECRNNLHQTGLAIKAFKADQNGSPNASEVVHGLDHYYTGNSSAMRRCPVDKDFDGTSYGVNPCVSKLLGESAKVVLLDAHETFVFFEGTSSQEWIDSVAPRHWNKNMNVLYYGGHVESALPEDINPYQSESMLTSRWKPTQPCDITGEQLGCGCRGTYYSGWWGGETSTRIDTSLHMPFGGAFFGFDYWNIPLEGSNTSGWDTGTFGSGTWSATLTVPDGGTYTFHLACDNEAWLYVDGVQMIHRNTGGVAGVTTYQQSAPVTFTKGQVVDIEVRLRELTPGSSPSHVSIKWESQNTPLESIPCVAMQPN